LHHHLAHSILFSGQRSKGARLYVLLHECVVLYLVAVNEEILRITEAIKAAVTAERIYLFGSYAYGTPSDSSDYDFFVVIPDDSIKPLDAMIQARRSMRGVDRKTSVDILADYKSRFDERKRYNTLERKIANEGLVLYER
jgi:predicted nucleotidyltransferase